MTWYQYAILILLLYLISSRLKDIRDLLQEEVALKENREDDEV